jgi:two-component system cell cycle response regulator DivK
MIVGAEDEDSNFYLISEALRVTQAKLIRARDGKDTIELFKKNRNNLNIVLMDIQMPEMDGYECTRIIKKENPDMPVIAQTAYAMSGENELSKEAGCDDYISKPLQLTKLIEKIAHHIK